MLVLSPSPALTASAEAPLRIPLRHVSAHQIIQQLRFPDGARQPGSGPEIVGLRGLAGAGKTLVVEGSAEARGEVERLVKILDVPQALLRVHVRVVKVEDVGGKRRLRTVAEGSVVTTPGRSFQVRTEDEATRWAFTGQATAWENGKIRSVWSIEYERLVYRFEGAESIDTLRNTVTSLCIGANGKPAVAAFFDTRGQTPARVDGATLEGIVRTLPDDAYFVEVTATRQKAPS